MTVSFRNFTKTPGFSDDFHQVREFLVRINKKNPIPQYHFEWGALGVGVFATLPGHGQPTANRHMGGRRGDRRAGDIRRQTRKDVFLRGFGASVPKARNAGLCQ